MSEKHLPGEEERRLPEFNAMQKVKRRFFAMRNGDLARQMADRGAVYRINFGLNLPQISEIARDFLPGGSEFDGLPDDFDMADFARRLRDNSSTRESMLIAPMIFPVASLTMDEAVAWVRSVPTPEVADILCLKLLRNWPEAWALVERLVRKEPGAESREPRAESQGPRAESQEPRAESREPRAESREVEPLVRYTALRLSLNLLQSGKITPGAVLPLLTAEESNPFPMTATLLRQLRDEISFKSAM